MGVTTGLEVIGYSEYFRVGMIVTAVMPTTTAMSTILTTLSGGNVPVAVANATLNNLLGIVCTPLLVMLLLSGTVSVDIGKVAIKLTYSILLPFLCGQTLRSVEKIKEFAVKHKPKFSIFNHAVLVVIIFCSFCNIYSMQLSDYGVQWYHILLQIFLNFFVHLIICIAAWVSTWWASMPDRVAIFFVAVQKTIVMGLPMLNELFNDDPLRDIYALPLIMYHPVELILGIVLGGRMRRRIEAQSPSEEASSTEGASAAATKKRRATPGLPIILGDEMAGRTKADDDCPEQEGDNEDEVVDVDPSKLAEREAEAKSSREKKATKSAEFSCFCPSFFFPRAAFPTNE